MASVVVYCIQHVTEEFVMKNMVFGLFVAFVALAGCATAPSRMPTTPASAKPEDRLCKGKWEVETHNRQEEWVCNPRAQIVAVPVSGNGCHREYILDVGEKIVCGDLGNYQNQQQVQYEVCVGSKNTCRGGNYYNYRSW
jgi:hypothetical protein